ncbi:MAG: bis(5'-nucleosyl)-tetraphosphatase (symmetrical) YqeK [Oscillospiraceae bacterium]
MYSLEELKSFLKKRLSKKRFIHSLNVADKAYKLAGMYGEDPDKAYLAGLLHDICKESPAAEQEELMLKGNMNISGTELASKALWHGPAGAYFIKSELGINDSDILNAVRYHTIGRSGMSKLEEIIYMADLISDDRDYKDVDKMRKLAYSDFERAMYEAVSYSIESVLKKQGYIPECTVNLYNQYSYIYSVHKKNKEKNDGKK